MNRNMIAALNTRLVKTTTTTATSTAKHVIADSTTSNTRRRRGKKQRDGESLQRLPHGYWKDPANQRRFLDQVGRELNVKQLDDWYNINVREVTARGGNTLIKQYYRSSLINALQAIYPEHAWEVSRFASVPRGYWQKIDNQRRFFDMIAVDLGVKELDDWYAITREEVFERGGGGLINEHYKGSIKRALKAIYPEHPWDDSRFANLPNGYWKNPHNQRQFFDKLGKELGIEQLDDWYNVSTQEVRARGGASLIKNFGFSLIRALQSAYPEHPWRMPSVNKVPYRFWNDLKNQRDFFDALAREMGFQPDDLDAWYNVTADEVLSRGGAGLLTTHYGSSLPRALAAIYPEHPWKPWRFSRTAAGASKDSHNLQQYVDALARGLGIQHLDDWYRVSSAEINAFGGNIFIKNNGGLYLVLKKLYPEHNWDEKKFESAQKRSSQWWLQSSVQRLFPQTEILENFLHPDLTYSESQQPMELDLYIPSLSLAFEYQGKQHFKDVYLFGPHSNYKRNDEEKLFACKEAGITLITVPYWWDRSHKSLASSISAVRPDLLVPPEDASPIPSVPPHEEDKEDETANNNNNNNNNKKVQEVNVAKAKKVSLPKGQWQDPANHRRFFDAAFNMLGFKTLNDWYTAKGADIRSLGGGGLLTKYYGNSLSRALQSVYPEHDWDGSKFSNVSRGYWQDPSNHRRFFERVARELGVQDAEDWYSVTPEDVASVGDKGLLKSHYDNSLYKVLTAVFPEHSWDESKFATSSATRGFWTIKRNQRKFLEELAKQLGIATLDDWYKVKLQDVTSRGGRGLLHHYGNSLIRALEALYPQHNWQASKFSKAAQGYWKDPANQRQLLDEIAMELGIKHLDDWYRVTVDDVASRRGGRSLLAHHGNSLARALQALYPEHKWCIWRFDGRVYSSASASTSTSASASASADLHHDMHTDNDTALLKDYIDALAAELAIGEGGNNLDDWYRVSSDQIRCFGGFGMLARHGGLPAVLRRLYPQHPWDEERFVKGALKKKSTQRWLRIIISRLYPDAEVIEDYLHPSLLFPDTRQPMQLDVYVPSLHLAFEYNGEQHAKDVPVFGGSNQTYHSEQRDSEKTVACKAAGITLITVPHWWDRKMESIAAMINNSGAACAPPAPSLGRCS